MVVLATAKPRPKGMGSIAIPPLNFAMVCDGIYRSGYPNPRNTGFLRRIEFKSVLYLCEEPYIHSDLLRELGVVKFFHLGTTGNKEPFQFIPQDLIMNALEILLDETNHPILIHCNKGIHRTGCVVASIRKVQKWSLTSIFAEYHRFAGSKARILDQQFLELLDVSKIPIPNFLL